jgi:hypothetical protein
MDGPNAVLPSKKVSETAKPGSPKGCQLAQLGAVATWATVQDRIRSTDQTH